jgi:tetratricopeptide (TPR) repeat protein
MMNRLLYRVIPFRDGWGVDHRGDIVGPYAKREWAFEAALMFAASDASTSTNTNENVFVAPHVPYDPSDFPKKVSRKLGELQALHPAEPKTWLLRERLCREVLSKIKRGRHPLLWAEIQRQLAYTLDALGRQTGNLQQMVDAARAYRQALLEMTRERAPLHWGAIQGSLGFTLAEIGLRTTEPEHFVAAIEAYQHALLEITRQRAPNHWAIAQELLGFSLARLGQLTSEKARFAASIDAYKQALLEITRERNPLKWARMQSNLGLALASFGELTGDHYHVVAAIEVYQQALLEITRKRVPVEWAVRMSNLGAAHGLLGELRDDLQQLRQAISSFQEALMELARQGATLEWATTVDNLGNVLSILGTLTHDQQHLVDAVRYCREALVVRTLEEFPQEWVATQNHLGTALFNLGRLTDDGEVLLAAVEAHGKALLQIDPDHAPLLWAGAQMNLGAALAALSRRAGDRKQLSDSAGAYREALLKITAEEAPRLHLMAARGLADIVLEQGNWPEAEAVLKSLLDGGLSAILTASSIGERRQMINSLSGAGDRLAWALLRQGRPEEALVAAGRSRAILLSTALVADQFGTGDAEIAAFRKARAAWQGACHAAQAVDAAIVSAGDKNEARLEILRGCRREAGQKVQQCYEQYRELLRDAGLEPTELISIAEVARSLPPGGALLLPIVEHAGTAVLILLSNEGFEVGGGRVDILELPGLSTESIGALMLGKPAGWIPSYMALCKAIEDSHSGRLSYDDAKTWNGAIRAALDCLWEQLMLPVSVRLRAMGIRQGAEVVLCPGSLLAYLPLHAAGRSEIVGQWRCFLDDYAVSYIPSPAALVASHVRAGERHKVVPTMLAVTNPIADPEIEVDENPASPFFISGQYRELRHYQATVQAVLAELKRTDPGWSYLSFYTHGHWNVSDPDSSGLEMADGLLTAQQLRQLNISAAPLAFLAACETGMIGPALPDEYIGLPAAFLEAGISAVIASLWPVEATTTQRLALAFFQFHLVRKLSPAQALRMAQLGLKDEAQAEVSDQASFASFEWAAFGLTGM